MACLPKWPKGKRPRFLNRDRRSTERFSMRAIRGSLAYRDRLRKFIPPDFVVDRGFLKANALYDFPKPAEPITSLIRPTFGGRVIRGMFRWYCDSLGRGSSPKCAQNANGPFGVIRTGRKVRNYGLSERETLLSFKPEAEVPIRSYPARHQKACGLYPQPERQKRGERQSYRPWL